MSVKNAGSRVTSRGAGASFAGALARASRGNANDREIDVADRLKFLVDRAIDHTLAVIDDGETKEDETKGANVMSRSKKNTPEQAGERAARAIAELRRAMPLDPDMDPHEVRAAMGYRRVPDAAIALAAEILANDAEAFPHLDPRVPGDALAYERAMKDALAEARALVRAIERSITKKRWRAARDATALYAAMKAKAKVGAEQRERDAIGELGRAIGRNAGSSADELSGPEPAR